MTLPNCYRCDAQPCTCKDGCTLYHGDCLEVMAGMEAESVQTCVTSPPYWGLRDYGVDGQLGLEETPEAYVAKMVEVFRGVRRVLRDDGTVWLNLGDSYAAGPSSNLGRNDAGRNLTGGGGNHEGSGNPGRQGSVVVRHGLKPKDLVGIPWRVAFALQADGWYLRQDIIWHKPNPMPESVTDRCTKAHEYLFLLAKSARYYYDAEAIKEDSTSDHPAGNKTHKYADQYEAEKDKTQQHRTKAGLVNLAGVEWSTRNRRSVWTVTTKPFKGAHFATFPPDLIEPCIKAGTSEEGCCPECGTPWVRVVEKEKTGRGCTESTLEDGVHSRSSGKSLAEKRQAYRALGMEGPPATKTTGWEAACDCCPPPIGRVDLVPCVVLDPFLGSGTTADVARKNGRGCVGIELNSEYLVLAARRLKQGVLF